MVLGALVLQAPSFLATLLFSTSPPSFLWCCSAFLSPPPIPQTTHQQPGSEFMLCTFKCPSLPLPQFCSAILRVTKGQKGMRPLLQLLELVFLYRLTFVSIRMSWVVFWATEVIWLKSPGNVDFLPSVLAEKAQTNQGMGRKAGIRDRSSVRRSSHLSRHREGASHRGRYYEAGSYFSWTNHKWQLKLVILYYHLVQSK
jgi:hypothetical protein